MMARMDWHRFLKRYVWDDDKTPYFTAVRKLTKRQADYELFAYVCFIGVLFTVIGLIFCSSKSPLGQSYGAAFYCFSVALSAVMVYATKDLSTAVYCAIAPVAMAAFVLLTGGHPNLYAIDILVILASIALLCWYSIRVVNIVRAYGAMPAARDNE